MQHLLTLCALKRFDAGLSEPPPENRPMQTRIGMQGSVPTTAGLAMFSCQVFLSRARDKV